jgi:heme-degrading monooxygenase HmoA
MGLSVGWNLIGNEEEDSPGNKIDSLGNRAENRTIAGRQASRESRLVLFWSGGSFRERAEKEGPMYARVVDVPFQPGKLTEASRIVEEQIIPSMQGLKGFRSQFLLTQQETGKAISINLWETAEDLATFEASPLYKELMGKLGGVLAGAPSGGQYEVSVQG